MKKIIIVLFIILLMIFLKLLITYGINYIIISADKKGQSDTVLYKSLYLLNFSEPYIAYYNNGNLEYNNGNYDRAIENYKKALSISHPMNRKDCKIRINLVLSMIETFDLNNLTEEKIKNILEIISEAKNVLTEEGCAKEYTHDGHNGDSETLLKELEELEKLLKSGDVKNDNKDSNQNKSGQNISQSTMEALRNQQKESNNNREMQNNSRINDINFSNKKNW